MKEKFAEMYQLLFGFRKFLITLMVLLVSVVFRAKNLLNGVEFVDLTKNVVICFIGANSVEGIVSVVKDHLAKRQAAGDVLAPPPEKVSGPDDEVELILPGDK